MNTLLQENIALTTEQFLADVIAGLSANQKRLSAKYFYDEKGDAIFQQIMNMDEYYLTNCEMDIFRNQAQSICEAIAERDDAFDLIELGAGDATKSIHLINKLHDNKVEFSYLPIDISANVISNLEQKLPLIAPNLKMKGFIGDYFEMLSQANAYSSRRKVVLFMGANIGNMTVDDAKVFCKKLRDNLSSDDLLIIGFDLKKNPKQILGAYNDKNGITRSFNMNLLSRINNQLGGNFNSSNFEHYASYDPESGACKSYLISLVEQEVSVGEEVFHFAANENIYMEISQKYDLNEIKELGEGAGFLSSQNFYDERKYFVDAIWKVK